MSLRARVLGALRAHPGVRHLASRVVFSSLGRQQRFRLIWALNLWGGGASRSGRASSLEATRHLRTALPPVLAELDVHTLLDVPCGDFTWMREVDLGAVRYVGVDIVPEIVARNRERYGDSARRSFIVCDATRDPLPPADAILCRHLLPHLSFRDALRVLAQFRQSGARWLLTTTFPSVEANYDIVSGDFRVINLQRPPFDLPPPSRTIDDTFAGTIENVLGVWDLHA